MNGEQKVQKEILKDFPYTFDPVFCGKCGGNCCTGKSGYIWVTALEITAIANLLETNQIVIIQEYLDQVGNRWSIRERLFGNHQYACTFFDIQNKKCRIYQARPAQCRRFPYWNYFRDHLEALLEECPGVSLKK